jgi:hypothetical protein
MQPWTEVVVEAPALGVLGLDCAASAVPPRATTNAAPAAMVATLRVSDM